MLIIYTARDIITAALNIFKTLFQQGKDGALRFFIMVLLQTIYEPSKKKLFSFQVVVNFYTCLFSFRWRLVTITKCQLLIFAIDFIHWNINVLFTITMRIIEFRANPPLQSYSWLNELLCAKWIKIIPVTEYESIKYMWKKGCSNLPTKSGLIHGIPLKSSFLFIANGIPSNSNSNKIQLHPIDLLNIPWHMWKEIKFECVFWDGFQAIRNPYKCFGTILLWDDINSFNAVSNIRK